MKKKLLILVLVALSTVFSFAQEIDVPQTQLSLINKIAADWCPPCGGWGWSFFHDLIEDNSEKAVLFTAHHSGGLQNQVASSITSNYGVSSQPRFILNSVDQNASSGNAVNARMTIKEKVDMTAASTPLVQTGLDATYREDDMVYVKTNTTFFNDASGEYYLGIYLIEKIVIGTQASVGTDAEHKNIIRLELTGNDFGNLLASGEIAAETSFANEISIPKEDYSAANLEIVTIIWEKTGNTYTFVNANKDSEVQLEVVNATEFPSELAVNFQVKPTIINDFAMVEFAFTQPVISSHLSLVNVQGKTIKVLHEGFLSAEHHSFVIENNGELSDGIYFVRLQVGVEVISRKIIIE
jgi:hypothetical protein